VAIDASKVVPDAATPHTESAQASDQDDPASSSAMLEIEVLGGVTDADLAAIVARIRKVKAEHRSSRISIEPIMPLASADPGSRRTSLIGEAGRVIDHVFVAIRQRIDISPGCGQGFPRADLSPRRSAAGVGRS
jgi:hypothetical protein